MADWNQINILQQNKRWLHKEGLVIYSVKEQNVDLHEEKKQMAANLTCAQLRRWYKFIAQYSKKGP